MTESGKREGGSGGFDALRFPPVGALMLYAAVLAVTLVLFLQNTKQAMLPARQTRVLWAAEAWVIASVLVLRSGWARDSRWNEAQARLGTLANNYYEPRRDWLVSGFAVGVGVIGALWWAAATWAVVLGGVRGGSPGRGLADFEVAAVMGAISGSLPGAVIGLVVGHVWEARHRRRRIERSAARA